MSESQLAIFSQQPFAHKPRVNKGEKVVISVSRRTDMVKWYPEDMLDQLATRYPPQRVHTLVLWTKFAEAVLTPAVRRALETYDNLYVHLTCTGMGKTDLEPFAPTVAATFANLPDLLGIIGGARHITLRIDPIFRARSSGGQYSNLPRLKEIMARGAEYGITHYTTSFLCHYPKVKAQMKRAGLETWEFTPEEQGEIAADLFNLAAGLGVRLDACAVPGLPGSRCIDPFLLTELHPQKLPCSCFEPRTRELCGCTHSIDIGGFYTKPCYTGCVYCYANMKRGSTGSSDV